MRLKKFVFLFSFLVFLFSASKVFAVDLATQNLSTASIPLTFTGELQDLGTGFSVEPQGIMFHVNLVGTHAYIVANSFESTFVGGAVQGRDISTLKQWRIDNPPAGDTYIYFSTANIVSQPNYTPNPDNHLVIEFAISSYNDGDMIFGAPTGDAYTNGGSTGCGIFFGYDFCTGLRHLYFNVDDTGTPLPVKHNPVIIVPGVLGTEISKGSDKLWLDLEHNLTDIGDQFMDPLQFNTDLTPSDTSLTIGDVIRKKTLKVFSYDYTNGLIDEFQKQNYTEGTDLFLFPYDWRFGVSESTANQLKQRITDILTQTNSTKIDIVAHSMGGLLVKRYVMENASDNKIGKALFVGVPNTGAPAAIKNLLEGDGNELTSNSEMKKISKNMPAAYDLTPSQRYFDVKGPFIQTINQHGLTYDPPVDLDFDQVNTFLTDEHELNAQALLNAHKLHTTEFDNYDMRKDGIDLYAINGCKTGTIGKVIEVNYHGLFGDVYTGYDLTETPGDGTVPLESSTNLPVNDTNKFYGLETNHGKMLSQEGIRQKIVNIISGSTLPTQDKSGEEIITQDVSECELNGEAISLDYGPLDIDVTDQNGNHAGVSPDGVVIENDIPGADFQSTGDHTSVYLPTDKGQKYDVKVIKTSKKPKTTAKSKTTTIKTQKIESSKVTKTEVFDKIPVKPETVVKIDLGGPTNVYLGTDKDRIFDKRVPPTKVIDNEQTGDFIPDQPEIVPDEPTENNPPDTNPPQNDSPNPPQGNNEQVNNPPVNNSQISVSVAAPSRSVALLASFSSNNTNQQTNNQPSKTSDVTPEVPKEITLEIPDKKEEKTKTLAFVAVEKNIEGGQEIPLEKQTEDLPQKNTLTANAIDTEVPFDYNITIGIFAAFALGLLLAKNFIKV